MYIIKSILFLLLGCAACRNTSEESSGKISSEAKAESEINRDVINRDSTASGFDKIKWSAKDDHHYPYRDVLLAGSLSNHTLDSLEKDEVIDLLGQPDRIDNNYLFYRISQKRMGFWPLHTKTLVIKIFEDGAIEWVRIHE